ncbi:molybdenum cofactor biosynthesis protein B [Pseudomonas sp. S31]|uniref:molybdenum cofactor biosynthesis protein B n=1 Tax=Pseudomonas sp. S31 TaxID=1564473 RepID=UPI001F2F905D
MRLAWRQCHSRSSTVRVQADAVFVPLNIAVLTVSDTRTYDNDTSGELLASRSLEVGHRLVARALLKDDLYKIRAQVATWIADDDVQVVLITGGTGFTGRDSTPEAVQCLLDRHIDGFGELFRALSILDIGSSTVQSRALAGMANGTLVCCLPGSTGACRTAWEGILAEQLDARHRPCNFVKHLKPIEACESRG